MTSAWFFVSDLAAGWFVLGLGCLSLRRLWQGGLPCPRASWLELRLLQPRLVWEQ